jgi:hypothetical protein
MKATFENVQRTLKALVKKTEQVKAKNPAVAKEDVSYFFYKTMHDLAVCSEIYLKEPAAIDLLLETSAQLKDYRGKGMQRISEGFYQVLCATVMKAEFSDRSNYTEKQVNEALAKIASYAFPLVKGDGKALRSMKAATVRRKYWELLTDISSCCSFPEIVELALQVATNNKASEPERYGAVGYLLHYLSFEDDPEDTKMTEKVKSAIDSVRVNPPSREMLFAILNAGVEAGEFSEMGALCELDDYDEKHDD